MQKWGEKFILRLHLRKKVPLSDVVKHTQADASKQALTHTLPQLRESGPGRGGTSKNPSCVYKVCLPLICMIQVLQSAPASISAHTPGLVAGQTQPRPALALALSGLAHTQTLWLTLQTCGQLGHGRPSTLSGVGCGEGMGT